MKKIKSLVQLSREAQRPMVGRSSYQPPPLESEQDRALAIAGKRKKRRKFKHLYQDESDKEGDEE